jgi:hypothetical protein
MKKISLYLLFFIAFLGARYTASAQSVVITEILYNQPGNDTIEFIELYNNSGAAIDLTGYQFTSGITHTFGSQIINAGGFIILAKNKQAVDDYFAAYGPYVPAIAWTEGGLDNNGEKLVLKDNLGNIVDSVEYDNKQPWDASADGTGPSLVLCDPNSDNGLGYNWTRSLLFHFNGYMIFASPGAIESCTAPGEIYPPYLKEDDAPTQNTVTLLFNEPLGTSAETTTNYTGLGTVNTAVRSATKETVTLTLATPLTIGQYYTVTISNIADTAGNVITAPITAKIIFNNTIAPLVITEIMYNNPGSDTLEYIEVYNNGSNPAVLGGYKFTNGIDFRFPDTTLNPGAYMVIPRYAAAFNQFFNMTTGAYEYSGSLSNTGEKITLKNTVGNVIDSLTYSNVSPWPTQADGLGTSLVLCNASDDNSIASRWTYATTYTGKMLDGVPIFGSPRAANTNCILSIQSAVKDETLFSMYPNPSSHHNSITLEFQEAFKGDYTLCDYTGKSISLGTISDSQAVLNLPANILPGLYFIHINDSKTGRWYSEKLVIQ